MKKEQNGGSVKKEILFWLKLLLAATIVALFINKVCISKTHVDSGSMTPLIKEDDYLICNNLAYLFSKPQRGDVIFLEEPDGGKGIFVKRVIGLPGEKLEITNGKVYIDDSAQPLDEPYLKEPMLGSFGPYYIPEGCYFVMGDNRNSSYDARGWQNPYLSKDKIIGEAWLRYKPHLEVLK